MLEEHLAMISTHLGLIARNTKRIADKLCGEEVPEKPAKTNKKDPKETPPAAPELTHAQARAAGAAQSAPATIQPTAKGGGTDMFETGVETPKAGYTELDVRNFAREVLDKKGWQVAEDILAKYAKTKKVKDVAVKDYSALIADYQEALKKKG